MDLSLLLSVFADILYLATPLLIAATGILIVEKSGVLNLGVEGMMIVGALAAYISGGQLFSCGVPSFDGSCLLDGKLGFGGFALATLIAGLIGALFASLFGFLVLILRANQVATGLGLTIFGLALTNAIGSQGANMAGVTLDSLAPQEWQQAAGGLRLLALNPLTYLSLLLMPLAYVFLSHTRAGLILRAVGENHDSAYTLGYSVTRIRFFAVLFGGLMCGIAGAYMSLAMPAPGWREGITNGFGWLALALILFGTWRPMRVLLGGFLFAVALSMEPRMQGMDGLPGWVVTLLLPSLPYILPIVVLALISFDAKMIRRNAPGSLGKPFEPN